jgi:hypothetical protein
MAKPPLNQMSRTNALLGIPEPENSGWQFAIYYFEIPEVKAFPEALC